MTILSAISGAVAGWLLILRNQSGWADNFRLTPAGLATALALFYLFAFLAVVLASLAQGVPTPTGLVEIMALNSLWLVALVAGIYATRFAIRDNGAVLPVLVPGIYALIAYQVAGTLVSMTLPGLLPLLWLGLLFVLFRLGRAAGGWTLGVSAAFSALTVVLLVALPMTLYMLATATASAA